MDQDRTIVNTIADALWATRNHDKMNDLDPGTMRETVREGRREMRPEAVRFMNKLSARGYKVVKA